MGAYLFRRILYGILVLVGVNMITFGLFFFVNSPDDMARAQLGLKRVTPAAVEKWKVERGYDKPLFVNNAVQGFAKVNETSIEQGVLNQSSEEQLQIYPQRNEASPSRYIPNFVYRGSITEPTYTYIFGLTRSRRNEISADLSNYILSHYINN